MDKLLLPHVVCKITLWLSEIITAGEQKITWGWRESEKFRDPEGLFGCWGLQWQCMNELNITVRIKGNALEQYKLMKPLALGFIYLCIFTSKWYLVILKVQRTWKIKNTLSRTVFSIVQFEPLHNWKKFQVITDETFCENSSSHFFLSQL